MATGSDKADAGKERPASKYLANNWSHNFLVCFVPFIDSQPGYRRVGKGNDNIDTIVA